MPEPNAKPALYLTVPSYRRWLTADMFELRVQLDGFQTGELETAVMHVTVQDAANEPMVNKTFVLDDPAEFVMPAPKIHGTADVVMIVEDVQREKILAEGRWRLTGLAAGESSIPAFFDHRNVLIAHRQAIFPRICEPQSLAADADPDATIEALESIGFNVLCLAKEGLPIDVVRKWAESAGRKQFHLLVSPIPGSTAWEASDARLAEVYERVRALRGQPGILGYHLLPTAEQVVLPGLTAIYQMVRRADSSRFVLLRLPETASPSAAGGFEDVLIVPAGKQSAFHEAKRMGLPVFGEVPAVSGRGEGVQQTLRYAYYDQLTGGSSGTVWRCDEGMGVRDAQQRLVGEAKALDELLRRGETIRWPPARLARSEYKRQGLRLWQRRFEDRFVLAAVYSGLGKRTLTFPAPPPGEEFAVLAEARTAAVKAGMITDEFDVRSVHVYTNAPELQQAVAPAP